MNAIYFPATVLSNDLIGEHVRYLKISLEEAIPYQPGQFFMLRLRNALGDYVERSYSVANDSQGDLFEFVIRIEPHGQMSSIINTLVPGDRFDLKGPFGRFGISSLPAECSRLVLIAGGVGISPLRSMLLRSLREGALYGLQLFYGFRTPKDFLFREELEKFAKEQGLDLIVSVSEEPQEPWSGKQGFITDHLGDHMGEPNPGVQSFICGPPLMVKSSREKLFALGFDRRQVHVEAW